MTDLEKCKTCYYMKHRVSPRDDSLHCYMFKSPPECNCSQFKLNTSLVDQDIMHVMESTGTH